jgi:hypothetical protein
MMSMAKRGPVKTGVGTDLGILVSQPNNIKVLADMGLAPFVL